MKTNTIRQVTQREHRLTFFEQSPELSERWQTAEQKNQIENALIKRQALGWLHAQGVDANLKVIKNTGFTDIRDEEYQLSSLNDPKLTSATLVQNVPTRYAFLEWAREVLKSPKLLTSKQRQYSNELAHTVKRMERPSAIQANQWLREAGITASE